MDTYVPYIVYGNLIKMVKYRNLTLKDPVLKHDEVIQKLNHYEFIIIGTERPSTDQRGAAVVHIVLVAPGSSYATKTGDFKKLLKQMPRSAGRVEIVFVSEKAFTIYIKKQIIAYHDANPNIHIEDYDYSKFMIEAPKHVSVPRHEICGEAELREFCDYHYITKEHLPKILQTDTQAIWLGLQPGMVVKVYRMSETTCMSFALRYCVK